MPDFESAGLTVIFFCSAVLAACLILFIVKNLMHIVRVSFCRLTVNRHAGTRYKAAGGGSKLVGCRGINFSDNVGF